MGPQAERLNLLARKAAPLRTSVFLLLSLLLIASSSAFDPGPGDIPPPECDFDIRVEPNECQTTNENVEVRLSGTWPYTCAPEYSYHQVDGNRIEIWAQEPLEGCQISDTRWSFTVRIGELEEGEYTVYGYIVDAFGDYLCEETKTFEVTPPWSKVWGLVCEDIDEDGECEPTEPKLPWVEVALRETPDGVDLATSTTGYNGRYEFNITDFETESRGSTYYIVETADPPGYRSVNSNVIEVTLDEYDICEETQVGDFCDIREPTPTSTPTVTPTPTSTPTPTPTPPAYFAASQFIATGPEDELDQVIQAVLDTVPLTQVERLELNYMRESLVMDLYEIQDVTPVEQVVALVNQEASDRSFDVFADPNYVTGRPPVDASPWYLAGSPAGGSTRAARNLFKNQWGFGENGLDLYTDGARSLPYTGAGVRIGVFDTSPFNTPGRKSFEEIALTVSHPNPVVHLTPPPDAPDISDHGLFVAGLAYALAPDSEIRLTRVLDQYGQGDLFTLNRALDTFIREALADSGTLTGSIINLSLGVHQPPNPQDRGLLEDVVALETMIFGAEQLGVTIVASSGNDSNDATVQPMQIPAVYSVVIGTSASNMGGERSCFSNRGDIAAPGGDGGRPGCGPMVQMCASEPEYCTIGPAQASDTNYAYWTGTSFTAPLVSGLAALILEKEDGAVTPKQVADAIYQGAFSTQDELGAGVIDLRNTLSPFNVLYLPLISRPPVR